MSTLGGSGSFQFRAVTGREGECHLTPLPDLVRPTATSIHPPSMSPSTLAAEVSPIWPLFQTVLGVSPPSSIVHLYRPHGVHSSSPLSKSRLCASPATFSLGEASLIEQHRRSYFISHLILLTCLSYSQKLNSLNVNFFTPCLLFSKVAFFLSPGSQPFPCV